MSAQFMRRNIRISVRLTEEEHRLLKEKMARIGVTNQEAFLRKMALDGLVIRLDLPELKQMISLLRYTSNNINQIAKRLNESGRAYAGITALTREISIELLQSVTIYPDGRMDIRLNLADEIESLLETLRRESCTA